MSVSGPNIATAQPKAFELKVPKLDVKKANSSIWEADQAITDTFDKGVDLAKSFGRSTVRGAKLGVKGLAPWLGLKFGRDINQKIESGELKSSTFNSAANAGVGLGQFVGFASAAGAALATVFAGPVVVLGLAGASGAGFLTSGASAAALGVKNPELVPVVERPTEELKSEEPASRESAPKAELKKRSLLNRVFFASEQEAGQAPASYLEKSVNTGQRYWV